MKHTKLVCALACATIACFAGGTAFAEETKAKTVGAETYTATYANTIKNGEVAVKLRRAGVYDDDMNVVCADTLSVVVGTAMRAECMLCVKDRAEIKRCRLRKAIDELCPPQSYETMTCVYRDLALDHVFPDTDPSKI